MAKVDYYIFPIKLCTNCWRYGHKVKACKSSKPRCVVCGLEHENNPCWAQPHCLHCGGPHKANDKNCMERVRQGKILQVMATERLTFIEAMRKFPKHNSVQNRLQSPIEFPLLPEPGLNDKHTIDSYQHQTQQQHTHQQHSQQQQTQQQHQQHTQQLHTQQQQHTQQQHTQQQHTHQQHHQLHPNANIPVTDIQAIVNYVKRKLLEQLNLVTIMDKIRTMQDTITKHNEQQTNNGTNETQTILTDIVNQMKTITNPEETLMKPKPLTIDQNGPIPKP